MRGQRNPQSTMLAFVNLEERVPPDHPLRVISVSQTTSLTACQTTSTGCTRRSVGHRSLPSVCGANRTLTLSAAIDAGHRGALHLTRFRRLVKTP